MPEIGVRTICVLANLFSPDDVVHAIGAAVDVLQGKSAKFTKIQARRILVHLVADVHQPLHTISGYFDCTNSAQPKLISNPLLVQKLPPDRGGNQLFYTKTLELHALWDTKLVNKLAHAKEPEPLAALRTKGASSTLYRTPGDYHEWPCKMGRGFSDRKICRAFGAAFEQCEVQVKLSLTGKTVER